LVARTNEFTQDSGYIFFRMYMKLTAFAAQTALYQKVSTAGTVAAADSASGNQAMGGAVPAAE
jgi:hypothetical protein